MSQYARPFEDLSNNNWRNSIASGLILYYKLDETGGTRYDSADYIGKTHSGNPNAGFVFDAHLTDTNTVGTGIGISGRSAFFDRANSEYLVKIGKFPSIFGDQTQAYTCCLWTQILSTGATHTFISFKDGNAAIFDMYYTNGFGHIDFGYGARGTSNIYTPLRNLINTGAWYFMVAQDIPSQNIHRLNIARANLGFSGWANAANSTNNPNNWDSISIGTSFGDYHSGYLDEIGVWNRILNDEEIYYIYRNGLFKRANDPLHQSLNEINPISNFSSGAILSDTNPNNNSYITKLSPLATGSETFMPRTGHLLQYTYRKANSKTKPIDINVGLYDSGVLIKEIIHNDISNTPFYNTGTVLLNLEETNRIFSYDNLKLKINANSESLNDGLIAYWRLDDSGATGFDSSNNNNTLFDTSPIQATFLNSGILNGCVFLDSGKNQFLSAVESSKLHISGYHNNFTLSAWIKSESYANQSAYWPILHKGSGNINNTQYSFGKRVGGNSNNELYFTMGNGSHFAEIYYTGHGLTGHGLASSHSLNNQWIHVLAWKDQNGYMYLQRNNGPISQIIWTGGYYTGNCNLEVGRLANSGFYTSGFIDEIGVWNRVLTSEERYKLYNDGYAKFQSFSQKYYNLTDNLVAYWRMNETGGTRYDSIGNHHLTDNNTVMSTGGLFDNSAYFVRTNNEYLSLYGSSLLRRSNPNSNLLGKYTMTFWLQMANVTEDGQHILRAYNPFEITEQGPNFVYYTGGYVGPEKAFVFGQGGQGPYVTGSFIAGEWYFISLFSDPDYLTNGGHYFRINNSDTLQGFGGGGDAVGLTGNNFYFGAAEASINGFGGRLDDVAIWHDRILTSQELSYLYNNGQGRRVIGDDTMFAQGLNRGLMRYWSLDQTGLSKRESINQIYNLEFYPNNTEPLPSIIQGKKGFGFATNFSGNICLRESIVDNNLNFPYSNFSTAFWFLPFNSGSCSLFSITDSNKELFSINNSNKISYRFFDETGLANTITSNNDIVTGSWNHVGIWYDKYNRNIGLHLNGHYQTSSIYSLKNALSSPRAWIGSLSGINCASGIYIDETMIWNRKLNSGEFNTLYKNGTGIFRPFDKTIHPTLHNNLVGHWKLTEAGGVRYDSLGLNNLSDSNTVQYNPTGGLINGAASFHNWNQEHLSKLFPSKELSFSQPYQPFSVAAWVKVGTGQNIQEPFVGIVSLIENAGYYENQIWSLTADRANERVRVFIGNNVTYVTAASTNGNHRFPTGSWTLMTYVYNPAYGTNNSQLFIKDTIDHKETAAFSDAAVDINTTQTNLNFLIGLTSNGFAGPNTYWDGEIGPVSYWKRALTTGEIYDIYNSGIGLEYPFYIDV